jgi:hypothetical protein
MMKTMMKTSLTYCALLCAALLEGGTAHATTQQEQTIFNAPMPHQLYSGGSAVKVHRARLDGYLDNAPGDAAALANLRQQVSSCTRALAASGRPLHPPTAWPDHAIAQREDVYAAANRTIRYISGAGYVVNPNDCSLMSEIVSRAELVSRKGVCKIDLVKKTARGDCDPSGHADAPIPPHNAPPQDAMARRLAATHPELAAAMQNVAALSASRTGQQRSILGARCEVWRQPIGGNGDSASLCYAVGGSFLPSQAVNQEGQGGLLLDNDTPHGMQLRAKDVRMDTEVGNAVFAPYAAGGFSVNAPGAQP